MKRIIAILLILLSLCSCTENAAMQENFVEATDVGSLSLQLGIDLTVPSDAKNIKCAVINDLIAYIEFVFDSIIFEYRSSKIYSDFALSGITEKQKSSDEIVIGDDITVEVYTLQSGGTLALWYENGNNHSLYCVKTLDVNLIENIVKQL